MREEMSCVIQSYGGLQPIIRGPCCCPKYTWVVLWSISLISLTVKFKMNRLAKPSKHTPFRDRQLATEGSDGQPTYHKQREFRFINNENQDSSNPVIEIKRKSRPSDVVEFECKQDYNACHNDDEDEVKRSMNLNSRFRSQSQEQLLKLTQSQEVLFRKPQRNQAVNSSLTFASIKGTLKNSLASNHEFMEDKKMKNEILDEIIKNASKKNLKSQELPKKALPHQQQRQESAFCCANQDGKKAKYFIVSESDSEEELYYCSKCSIMLLQQGFNVQEISHERKQAMSRRRKDCDAVLNKITDFQGRLKYHLSKLDEDQSKMFGQARSRTEQTYDIILFIVEQMKARELEDINQSEERVRREITQMAAQKKKQKAKLTDKFRQLQAAREELSQLVEQRLSGVTEAQLNSALDSYADNLAAYERYEPLSFELKEEALQQKLERLINEVNEHYNARRENFSFQSEPQSSPSSELAIGESVKKPFRGLFIQQEPATNGKKKNSRYYNGEFIREEDENFSPNFKKYH